MDIGMALTAITSAYDLATKIKNTSDASLINTISIDLQQKILTAQQAQSELSKSVSELEAEVARLKDWSADKAKYQLKDVGNGTFAYAPREGEKQDEPAHYLCANCYSNNERSLLQKRHHDVGRAVTLDCHKCKSYIVIHGVLHDNKKWL